VDIREIDPRDEELVRRHWEIGKAAEAERPYDFYVPWKLALLNAREGRDDLDTVLLGAFEDGTMWGAARVDLGRYDNLHIATSTYYTHPDRRRRGLARAMAETSYDVARGHKRSLMITEAFAPFGGTSPGLQFGEAMGFTKAIEDGMKVVDLDETEPSWDAIEARVAPHYRDYRIVTWIDRMPDDLVDGYCQLSETFVEEAPMGDLDVEPEKWDEARLRKREERNARTGRHTPYAVAIAPDGTMAGFTEVMLNESTPWRGIQSGTLVAPEHRGRKLGLGLKIANHRQLREHFPKVQVLLTGNADVNAPMNAVNDALGYREVERCIEMQRGI
jgi:GNAT superfamily N-acetyltransferase